MPVKTNNRQVLVLPWLSYCTAVKNGVKNIQAAAYNGAHGRLNIHNQLCTEDTSLRDFYIMTLILSLLFERHHPTYRSLHNVSLGIEF
jgi:hypothetical protein